MDGRPVPLETGLLGKRKFPHHPHVEEISAPPRNRCRTGRELIHPPNPVAFSRFAHGTTSTVLQFVAWGLQARRSKVEKQPRGQSVCLRTAFRKQLQSMLVKK